MKVKEFFEQLQKCTSPSEVQAAFADGGIVVTEGQAARFLSDSGEMPDAALAPVTGGAQSTVFNSSSIGELMNQSEESLLEGSVAEAVSLCPIAESGATTLRIGAKNFIF